MALDPKTKYPTKFATDSDYTYGKAQNVSAPNSGTGSPWDAPLINDEIGFNQALLDEAQIVPSGTADSAALSEYYQAVQIAIERQAERYVNTSNGAKSLSERIGNVRDVLEVGPPYSASNSVTGGPWRNVAPGYDPVTRKETALFIEDGETTKIFQVSNRTKDFVQVQAELSITLAANHVPDSLCCDGAAVYILCHSAATGTAAIVYKFAWNSSTLIWNSTPVWSTALSAGIRDARDGSTVIKIADELRVVVLCNGVSLTTGVEPLSVLLKSNGTETTGHGNAIVGDRFGGTGLCLSSGSIWFITKTAGDETYYINGAQIINPTLAPTNYATPTTISGGEPRVGSLESNGYMIVMPAIDGSINTFNTTDGTVTHLTLAQFNIYRASCDDFPVCCYDGARFWTYWIDETANSFLKPIDLDKMLPQTPTYLDRDESTLTSFPWVTTQVSDLNRMCYSDGCLWLIPDANTTHNSITAQRIPRLALR